MNTARVHQQPLQANSSTHFRPTVPRTNLHPCTATPRSEHTRHAHNSPATRPIVRCNAGFGGGKSSATPKSAKQEPPVRLPESREEAVNQAANAIKYQLSESSKSKQQKKVLGLETGKKVAIEIPVMDESTAGAVAVAQEVISSLPSDLHKQFTIVSCGSGIPPASQGPAQVVSLEAIIKERRVVTGCILFAAPSTQQLQALEQVVADWRGPIAVVLNPQWASELPEDSFTTSVPPNSVAFAKSFSTVYCFFPIAIKAFVITAQEGAVFRNVDAASTKQEGSAGVPWRVFMRNKNDWDAVGRMATRPTSTDIEVTFYNASASNSPLTKGAKMLKGLMSKDKK